MIRQLYRNCCRRARTSPSCHLGLFSKQVIKDPILLVNSKSHIVFIYLFIYSLFNVDDILIKYKLKILIAVQRTCVLINVNHTKLISTSLVARNGTFSSVLKNMPLRYDEVLRIKSVMTFAFLNLVCRNLFITFTRPHFI